ncbi:hypothetical protein AB0D04_14760 [Streptomyces sp. NPDC048483]|uniref:hypothetical protein n=1 Tax=Streptomyces sp. NPDC048483 TaxID=3154927 RepID=UPI0034341225
MQRAPKIRLVFLAGTAVLAVVVPLAAATAGPADTAEQADEALAGPRAKPAGGPRAQPGAPFSNTAEKPADKAEKARRPGGPLAGLGLPLLSGDGGRTSRCGPELASPRGIEAQTCVLAEQGLTWGRTYYRNPTGAPLRAVLTLLRPDGRTVQVHCDVAAEDLPGLCETPTGRTVRQTGGLYGVVAEISDAAGERLLLRSGGNSAPGAKDSDRRRKG